MGRKEELQQEIEQLEEIRDELKNEIMDWYAKSVCIEDFEITRSSYRTSTLGYKVICNVSAKQLPFFVDLLTSRSREERYSEYNNIIEWKTRDELLQEIKKENSK